MSNTIAQVQSKAAVLAYVEMYATALQAKIDAHMTENFPTLPRVVISVEVAQKFAKIVRNDGGSGGSVHSFVDLTNGNVLKAASWKAPVKNNPRSNVFDQDNGMSGVGVYGANYLRG